MNLQKHAILCEVIYSDFPLILILKFQKIFFLIGYKNLLLRAVNNIIICAVRLCILFYR